MTELVDFWLKNLLDIKVDYLEYRKNPHKLVELIFKIFLKYGLINQETKELFANAKTIEEKFRLLKDPFKFLNISIDSSVVPQIKSGNTKASVSILSQLYLKLAPNCTYKFRHLAEHESAYRVSETRFHKFKVCPTPNESATNWDAETHQGKHFNYKQNLQSLLKQEKITKICTEECTKVNPRHKLNQDIQKFDSKFITRNHQFESLIQLQQESQQMIPENWNPKKYKETINFIAKRRQAKQTVFEDTKNLILNSVMKEIEQSHDDYEKQHRKEALQDTKTEKKFKAKLKAVDKLKEMEEVHVKQQEKETKRREQQERERQKIEKAKKEFERKREAIEAVFNKQKEEYEAQKKVKIENEKEMINKIFDSLIILVATAGSQACDTTDEVKKDWLTLAFHSKPLYSLPCYESSSKHLKPILIEQDSQQLLISEAFNHYQCKQRVWNLGLPKSNTNSTNKLIEIFKKIVNKPQITMNSNIDNLNIRGILQTNILNENEKIEIIKNLKKILHCGKILVIDLEEMKQESFKLCEIEQSKEYEDGFCEKIEMEQTQLGEADSESVTSKIVRSKKSRKSNLKKSDAQSILSSRTRKSVMISESVLSKPSLTVTKVTHQTMTPSWDTTICRLINIVSKIKIETNEECEMDSLLKLELLLAYLEIKTEAKGFILVDFFTDMDDLNTFERVLTGDKQSSFFTHFIRLKNVSPLFENLYFDEINREEFEATKRFYRKNAAYHEVSYETVSEMENQVLNILDDQKDQATKDFKSSTFNFIRIPRTLKISDVEVQVDFKNVEQPNSEDYPKILSKFYSQDQLFLWNAIQDSYREKITTSLEFRSEVKRESLAMKLYYKGLKKRTIEAPIHVSDELTKFMEEYRKLPLFYRTDEDGKLYLLSLISDLNSDLLTTVEEQHRAVNEHLRELVLDNRSERLAQLICRISRKLLHSEVIKFVNVIRLLCEIFSLFLRQEITTVNPDFPTPAVSKSTIAEDEKIIAMDEVDVSLESSQLSLAEIDIPNPSLFIEAEVANIQNLVEHHASTVSNIAFELESSISPQNEEELSNSHQKFKLGSTKSSISRKNPKIETIEPDSKEIKLLKTQFLECIDEQRTLSLNFFNQIKSRAENDLEEILFGNFKLFQEFKNDSKKLKSIEVLKIEKLIANLVQVVDDGACEVFIEKSTDYHVRSVIHAVTEVSPSESTAKSLEPDLKSLQQLTEILKHKTNYLLTSIELSKILKKFPSVQGLVKSCSLIDWRDFILAQLRVPTPSLAELLEMKYQADKLTASPSYTIISKSNFFKLHWILKLQLEMQQILFKIFKSTENSIDHKKFLFSLCKDVDPIKGFGLALSFYREKPVNVDFELGQEYLKLIHEKKNCVKLMEKETKQFTRQTVCKLIHDFPGSIKNCSVFEEELGICNIPSFEKLLKMTPVEKYLESHQLLNCGCPIPVPNCDDKLSHSPFADREFWIDIDSIKNIFKIYMNEEKIDLETPTEQRLESIFENILKEHELNEEGDGKTIAIHLFVNAIKYEICNSYTFRQI